MHPSNTASSTATHDDISLPSLFKDGSKATTDINGVLHKGYIKRQANNTYRFSVQLGPRPPTELWEVPLHEFKQHWVELTMDETLFPVHNPSARSFVLDCPASLTAATYADHPDWDTWLLSY